MLPLAPRSGPAQHVARARFRVEARCCRSLRWRPACFSPTRAQPTGQFRSTSRSCPLGGHSGPCKPGLCTLAGLRGELQTIVAR
eukprot:769031-Alexandrium_andersonii.AAC.1